MGRSIRTLFVILLHLLLSACASPEEPPASTAPTPDTTNGLPVDAATADSVAGVGLWGYRLTTEADLDADGMVERLVLAADVETDPMGRPVWDDGQRWAVWVDEPDSSRTFLYRRLVQLGYIEAVISRSDVGQRVMIYERGPLRREAWDVSYLGPGRAQLEGRTGGPIETTETDVLEPDV